MNDIFWTMFYFFESQRFPYISLALPFELCELGNCFGCASHDSLQEFGPVPPDGTGVIEPVCRKLPDSTWGCGLSWLGQDPFDSQQLHKDFCFCSWIIFDQCTFTSWTPNPSPSWAVLWLDVPMLFILMDNCWNRWRNVVNQPIRGIQRHDIIWAFPFIFFKVK